MSNMPKAMVMAAGLGRRMLPLTETMPKPLVSFAGKALIDHALDRLEQANIEQVVVNVHHLADQVEEHLRNRTKPSVIISDERAFLLETGGGAKKALEHLGPEAFYVLNSDSVWQEDQKQVLQQLYENWDSERMDSLLMLAETSKSIGYDGAGDFSLNADGTLVRKGEGKQVPFVNMGVYLIHPRLFESTPEGAFSMNLLWDRALQNNRLFGLAHDGEWMHLGTPQSLHQAQAYIQTTQPDAAI